MERAQLIAQLKAAQRELEAARQRDAELAVLRERERLARDMHDHLGHALVALSVQLEAIQRLYAVDPARAATQVEEMKNLTRDSMAALRRSLQGLRAPGLGERPLTHALQTLSAEVMQRSGIAVACRADNGADALAPALAETLWAIALEALTNVEKHARAHHAQIELHIAPTAAVLRVGNDGVPLPPDAERRPGHYGLIGIRERVEGLGGTFALCCNDDGNTLIEARLPIISHQ